MQADRRESAPGSVPGGRLVPWLPMLLLIGGFGLPWLPGQGAATHAVVVGLYLVYAAAVTGLHFLPWLSTKLT